MRPHQDARFQDVHSHFASLSQQRSMLHATHLSGVDVAAYSHPTRPPLKSTLESVKSHIISKSQL